MINPDLTFQNYKEPLKEIPRGKGFGYYGAVLMDKDSKYIQCHICGDTFNFLGRHLKMTHEVGPIEYRKKFQLAATTSLVSEERRKQFSQELIKKWQDPTYRRKMIAVMKKSRKEKRSPHTYTHELETANKRGACPDQIIEKVRSIADKLGYTPSVLDLQKETGTQRYEQLIRRVFGSYKNLLKMAKLEQKVRVYEYTGNHYTDEDLLEHLRIFYQENQKLPTCGDALRGLIPPYTVYRAHFGSLPEARRLARLEPT